MSTQHNQEWYGKNTTRLTQHKHYNLIYYQCNGTGTCIDYPLFPGINLIFMDFNCTDTFKETLPSRDLLDIRHYQHGRVEFEFQNQKVFHMRKMNFVSIPFQTWFQHRRVIPFPLAAVTVSALLLTGKI